MSELVLRAWGAGERAAVLVAVPDADAGRTRWVLAVGREPDVDAVLGAVEACPGGVDVRLGGLGELPELAGGVPWEESDAPPDLGDARLEMVDVPVRHTMAEERASRSPTEGAPAEERAPARASRSPSEDTMAEERAPARASRSPGLSGPPPGVDAGAFFDLLDARRRTAANAAALADAGARIPRLAWRAWRIELPPDGRWRVLLGAATVHRWDDAPSTGDVTDAPIELHLPG